jgi:flagellar assembly protein FliH
MRSIVDDAAARAREEGRAEGVAIGRADAGNLQAAISAAIADGLAHLEAWRAAHAQEVIGLAIEIARAVVNREPGPDGMEVAARVRAALEQLDDGPLVVRVHPSQSEDVAAALATKPRVSVAADESVEYGGALVDGPWSHADVTLASAWRAASNLLTDS